MTHQANIIARSLRFIIAVTIATAAFAANAAFATDDTAAETVSVRTKTGRTFQGVLDAKTNDTTIWIRFGTTQAQILRPVAWNNVATVKHNGTTLSGAEFRKVADKLKTAAPKMPLRSNTRSTDGRTDAQRAKAALADPAPRVASIEITAQPANWDGDVEVDGLVVFFYARDANGNMIPTRGNLEIELISEMSRVRETITAGQSRIRNQRIARWTRQVEPEHFAALGASYRLPFQAVHPEFDHKLIDVSLVNARLSVPGVGTFNASAADIRVRPYSPFRTRHANRHGSRFAPIEHTGHAKVQ